MPDHLIWLEVETAVLRRDPTHKITILLVLLGCDRHGLYCTLSKVDFRSGRRIDSAVCRFLSRTAAGHLSFVERASTIKYILLFRRLDSPIALIKFRSFGFATFHFDWLSPCRTTERFESAHCRY